MDVWELKEHIIRNPDSIPILLESCDFHNIADRGVEFRCSHSPDSNPTSIRVDKETLGASWYGEDVKGDIISLIDYRKKLGFRNTLKFILNTLELDEKNFQEKETKLPFGGFYKKISKSKQYDTHLEPLPFEYLRNIDFIPSQKFFEDGISLETQDKFMVGYHFLTGRIAIPWFDLSGNIVGVIGRHNARDYESNNKYYPIIQPFLKSRTLYGYSQNYCNISEKGVAIVVESEKGVMQLDTMDIPVGLGLGGSALGDVRVKAIHSTNARTVILALDEGIKESVLISMAEKIKIDNPFKKVRVGYIYDRDNKYLEKDSKDSPTDHGKEVFKALVKECVVWI